MQYLGASDMKSRSYAVQGALFTLSLIPLALIDLHIFSTTLSFIFVPLIGIYLWPRGAATSLSYILIFLCGLIMDLASGGPIGIWPLLYLLTFGILRPDARRREISLQPLWLGFISWMAVLVIFVIILNGLFMPEKMQLRVLILQACVVCLLFPFIYSVRQFIRNFVVSSEDTAFH